MPLLNLLKILLLKQFVIVTPQKLLNRISCNFVVEVDILCKCAYSQEFLIQFLWEKNIQFCALRMKPDYHMYMNVQGTEKLFGYVFDSESPNVTHMWKSLIDYV